MAAAGGAASLAFVGCGDDDDGSTPPESTPGGGTTPTSGTTTNGGGAGSRRGGVFHRYAGTDTEHLDPALDTSNLMHFGAGQLYAKLLRWDASGTELLPDLAESLPEVTDDGLQYTYTLREGLAFHDGSPLTSTDVKFTYERLIDPDLQSFHGYKAGPIDAIETPDDRTVTFRMQGPFVPFVGFSGSAWMFILSEAFVSEQGPRFQETLSSGPYMLTEHNRDVSARFERNPEYYDPEIPYPDAIEFQVINDQASADAALISENIDLAGSVFSQARLESILDANPSLNDYAYPVRHHQLLLFNCERGPFTDPRLRRAVSYLIDRDFYRQVVLSTGGNPSGPVPWAFEPYALTPDELSTRPGYRPDKDEDIAEAISLLETLGLDDGFTIQAPTLAGPSPFNSQSVALQQQLAQYGIDLELSIVDFPALNQIRANGEFDAMCYINGGTQEIDEVVYGPNHTGEPRNVGRFSDPDIDAMLERQREIVDAEERRQSILEIQDALLEAQPTAWLADPIYHTVTTSRVGGYAGAPVFDWASELHGIYIDEQQEGGARVDLT